MGRGIVRAMTQVCGDTAANGCAHVTVLAEIYIRTCQANDLISK